MSLRDKLSSKNFFLVNLVLLGILIGFSAAFVSLTSTARTQSSAVLHAEGPGSSSSAVTEDGALANAESLQTAFNRVAEAMLPSVVELDVVETVKSQAPGANQFPWRFFFGNPQEDGKGSPPPREYQEQGLGSGILVRKDGKTVYVLTNAHVAGNASEITVKLYDEREFKGELVGKDERKDMAVVKFTVENPDSIRTARLGDSDKLKVGDWAIAIGSPFGLFSSVTTGIVSALNRSGGPDGNISDFIQTDAAINRGNSGGALVNIRGEVVGVNTWIASPSGGNIGLGFSLPINNLKKGLDDIIGRGKVQYGWLGVLLREVDKTTARELGIEGRKGAFISNLYLGSPAEKGGIQPGDFVVSLNGKTVASVDQLIRQVGDLPVGKKAEFAIVREGRSANVTVTIEARKDGAVSDNSKLFPGLELVSLETEGLPKDNVPKGAAGVYLSNVIAKTPADTVGLKPGDIVQEVNDRKIQGRSGLLQGDQRSEGVQDSVHLPAGRADPLFPCLHSQVRLELGPSRYPGGPGFRGHGSQDPDGMIARPEDHSRKDGPCVRNSCRTTRSGTTPSSWRTGYTRTDSSRTSSTCPCGAAPTWATSSPSTSRSSASRIARSSTPPSWRIPTPTFGARAGADRRVDLQPRVPPSRRPCPAGGRHL